MKSTDIVPCPECKMPMRMTYKSSMFGKDYYWECKYCPDKVKYWEDDDGKVMF